MADKQLNYPIGLIPSWANDENLNDPGQPWDATPTKVEPGAGKRDDGYLPEENPAAQHLNQKFHEIGLWLQYFSTMQVMNWFDSGEPLGSCTCESLTYDEGVLSWIFAGRADVFTNSRDGQTFDSGFNSGTGQTWTYAASKRPEDTPTHTGARSLFCSIAALATNNVVEFTGSFAAQALPHTGNCSATCCVWDRINQLWIVAGIDDTGGTPAPSLWSDATPISGFTQHLPTPNNSAQVIHLCHGEDGAGGALNVGIGEGTAPNFDVFTSTNGTTWTAAAPTGITAGEEARAVMWDPARELFVLLTDKRCYTSTNGTAWSDVSGAIGGDFNLRCLASDGGGLYVAASEVGEPVAIRYSNDGGATWRLVAVPPSENGGTDPVHHIVYSRIASRFGIVWVDDDAPPVNAGNFAMSLAIGETLYEVDTYSVPAVT